MLTQNILKKKNYLAGELLSTLFPFSLWKGMEEVSQQKAGAPATASSWDSPYCTCPPDQCMHMLPPLGITSACGSFFVPFSPDLSGKPRYSI